MTANIGLNRENIILDLTLEVKQTSFFFVVVVLFCFVVFFLTLGISKAKYQKKY